MNLDENLDAMDVNMVTCGSQATIPVVHAINSGTPVHYGEIVASAGETPKWLPIIGSSGWVQ